MCICLLALGLHSRFESHVVFALAQGGQVKGTTASTDNNPGDESPLYQSTEFRLFCFKVSIKCQLQVLFGADAALGGKWGHRVLYSSTR